MSAPTRKASKRPWRIGAVLAVALALGACGDRQRAEKPPEAGDVAVARVDGRTVWSSDVKREAIAQGLIGQGEPLDAGSDMFRQVLEQVIDQKLLATEAVKKKLDKDPVVQRRLAAARERILGDILIEGVVSQAVTENAIRGLHQEQLRLAKQSEEIRARQIVVATEPEAQALLKLLAAGGSFEALAMERSTDAATRFNGGDLGYFTIDVMPETYSAALRAAKVGDVIGPFQTEEGWTVMKVEDRRPEPPLTLEAARPQIVRFLTYDQVRDLLERLRGRAKVEHLRPADASATAPREPASAPPPAKAEPPAAAPKTETPEPAKPEPAKPAPAKAAPAKPAPVAARPRPQPPRAAPPRPVPHARPAQRSQPARPVERRPAARPATPGQAPERTPPPVQVVPAPLAVPPVESPTPK